MVVKPHKVYAVLNFLSANPKYFSNTEESVKIIHEIVLPYVDKQAEKLDNQGQAALLILSVFRG